MREELVITTGHSPSGTKPKAQEEAAWVHGLTEGLTDG